MGNGGDEFSLERNDGVVLWTLSCGDDAPWPGGTDGDGHSLVFVDGDPNAATSWRASVAAGGSPGGSDSVPLQAGGDLISYAIGRQEVAFSESGQAEFHITTILGADDVSIEPEWSADLESWSSEGFVRSSQTPLGDGNALEVWTAHTPEGAARVFFRCRLSL